MRTRSWMALVVAGLCYAQNEPQPRVVDPGGPDRPPSDALVLFDGKDLSHWTLSNGQPARCDVSDGVMTCKTGAGDIYSKEKFRGAQIHLEFAPPNMPEQHSQSRGNSGVYLQGRYEIQILDSYHNPTYPTGACGALYGQAPPLVNASRPPAQWQTYDMIFHGPKCSPDGKTLQRATVTVLHNGVLVQDHVDIKDSDKGCGDGGGGPLMLQDHNYKGAPVTLMRFRNIWLRPLED